MDDKEQLSDKEQLIAQLSAACHTRPSGLLQLLKRAPNSLRWWLIIAYWRLCREVKGAVHRLQNRRVAHLLHIGKTGGTATKKALKGYEHAGDYELVLHEHQATLKDIPFGEKVIFFVRDPISRFVSGFYGRQRQDLPRHNAPWTPDEEIAFRRFTTPNELALALSSDDQERREAAVHAIQSIDHLKAPHWTWFTDERYFAFRRSDILLIGFQQTLTEDFALLKNILNLPEDVSLPEDDVAAHRNPGHVDKSLDAQAIRNLKIWYARDYQFLGICRDVASQIQSNFRLLKRDHRFSQPAETSSSAAS
jgi:hypothetical protein